VTCGYEYCILDISVMFKVQYNASSSVELDCSGHGLSSDWCGVVFCLFEEMAAHHPLQLFYIFFNKLNIADREGQWIFQFQTITV